MSGMDMSVTPANDHDREREQAERDARLTGLGFLIEGLRVDPSLVTVIRSSELTHDKMTTTALWKGLEQALRDKGASDQWLDYAMPALHTAAAQFGFSCWGDGYLACERGDPMPNRQTPAINPVEAIARAVLWHHYGIAWDHAEAVSRGEVCEMVAKMLAATRK